MRKVRYLDIPSMEKARLRNEKGSTIDFEFCPSDYLLNHFKNKKYFIHTYGCQANIRDGEVLAGILEKLQMAKTEIKEEANIIILNTCAVRENAEDKVYGEIGDLKAFKEKNKDCILMICGCMIEQKHIIDFISTTFPFVDILFGTHNIIDLGNLLEEYVKNDSNIRLIDVSSKVGDIYEELPSVRDNKFKAYVNISYGCNKFCTYCIVPYTRGRERSRSKEDILKECCELVKNGYQEITLLGQNVDSYGNDLNDGTTFANLLESVALLGIPRLRFLTSYPSDFKDDVIDVISKYPNIMKFIHLPIQSGNDEVLRLMARRYTSTSYLELVKRIRNKIPNIHFSTDIIVGFPNETYEEFLDTIKVANLVNYTSAFTFIYSPRKGTPAAKLVDNVTYEEKVKRFKELVKALEIGFEKHAEEMVGKTYSVLVEGESKKNKEILSGYTENMKTVNFKGDISFIGKIVNVRITENHLYFLTGELINE